MSKSKKLPDVTIYVDRTVHSDFVPPRGFVFDAEESTARRECWLTPARLEERREDRRRMAQLRFVPNHAPRRGVAASWVVSGPKEALRL